MNGNPLNPPRLAEWILSRIADPFERISILGDFGEFYSDMYSEKGRFKAWIWYWLQLLRSIPSFIRWLTTGSGAMLKNYIKITFRNIRRNKGYTFINITGLAVGMACCIMMLLWVQDELSYDKFHEKADRIFRTQVKIGDFALWASSPGLLAPALKRDFPEVEGATRMRPTRRILLRSEEQSFYENSFSFADPDIFDIFSFPFISGDPKTALSDPGSVVLTESKARQFFGDEDPIGKVIQYGDKLEFTVSGVIKDIPNNSSVRVGFIAPFKAYEKLDTRLHDWGRYDFQTYVLLRENTDPQQAGANVKDYLMQFKDGLNTELFLQPLTRIHLYDSEGMGDIIYVYMFSSLAVFILVIASINFINLTTARSGRKAKEVGMRKVVGARRKDLIKQLMGESIIMSFIAFIIAMLIVILFLPAFNSIAEKHLSLNIMGNFQAFTGLVSIVVFTGIFSGIYPSLVLSSFKPVNILGKAASAIKGGGVFLRKSLVILQYSISIILMIATIVVYNQIGYIRNSDLGFDREHLVYIRMNTDTFKQYFTIKDELQKYPGITGITATEALPTYMANWSYVNRWDGKTIDGSVRMNSCAIDRNFIEMFDMEIIEGSSFSEENSAESAVFIVNEEAVRQMQIDDPVGKRLNLWGRYNSRIIGVVKDFHFRPLTQKIEPIILRYHPGEFRVPGSFSYICVRLRSENLIDTMDKIENTMKGFAPDYPFEYGFLDERIENLYRAEKRMGRIFGYFAVLAILISCLGLFGLVSFMAEQRRKEIGIRKVLGAAVSGIVMLISREFIILAVAANVIAWPVAYFVMNRWLQSYAYRVDIGWMVFIVSAFAAVIITLITIAFQSVKAAIANPVTSLRYE